MAGLWADFLGKFPKFQTPKRRRGVTPKYGRQKLKFPEIAQNHDYGCSMVPSGCPVHQDTLLSEIG